MSNRNKHANALELNKILSMLSEKAALPDAVELAASIEPVFEIGQVEQLLRQTSDAYMLMARFGAPSFGFAKNVNSVFRKAEAGSVLNMGQLLQIGELFRVIRSVDQWRSGCSGVQTVLDSYFSALEPNKYFEEKIFFTIKSEEEMNDNASPALADIRRNIRNANQNIKTRLDKIVRGSDNTMLQDSIITQRQGRYVVPVKAEYRGQLPGLVHDTSASGATLFVEPMAVVEINNEIKVLKSKEQDEMERILAELSAEAAQFAFSAINSYNALVCLDLCFAKANLAYDMKASVPELNCEGKVFLKNARHPLISKKSVVPITVSMGQDYSVLVITGPNTGGKTVTLKTVGLLTLMTCCGLMIPVDDNSTIAVFDSVYADIGDEQSIEQSLSTFSSHMNNIIEILRVADANTLVLFDELCSGTDPVEGAALSVAILNELKARGSSVIATTHYAELKSYALDTNGVENACCEFDLQTLQPTYRLLIGIPGRSNAFAISKRLGLEDRLVEAAKGLVSTENARFEEIVGCLEQAHVQAEKDRLAANVLKSKLEQSQKSAGDRLKEINLERDKIIEKARKDANEIIEYARSNSNQLLNEIEDLKKQLNKQNSAELAMKARTAAKHALREMEKHTDYSECSDPEFVENNEQRPLVSGDTVRVKGFSRPATVERVDPDGKQVHVVIGQIKTKVPVLDVVLLSANEAKKKQPRTRTVRGMTPKSERVAKRELDIRGFACDEGLMELDRFIDDAVVSGVETITIIHGKGTGVLKKAVRSHLRIHPSIATSRPGVYGEGEDGVTVAELK